MIRLYASLAIGHLRQHRLEALLCLIGVALGVAVVIGVEGAVDASIRSFGGAVSSLAERSTHSIVSTTGTISDAVYIDLRKRGLAYPLAPMIDRGVLLGSDAHQTVGRLIGIDVFAERPLRSVTRLQSTLDQKGRERFLTEPNQVVLVDTLAHRLGVKAGDTLTLTAGGARHQVTVAGVAVPQGVARAQLTNLVIADLSTAQELCDCVGSIDRIDTRLDNAQQADDLRADLPAGLQLVSTQQQAGELNDLTAAYQLNLHALSLMASFVAVFIVYNAMLVSVQQRVGSLGILRCLGASRWQLGGLYLVEAFLYSIAGAGVGLLAGWGLAAAMVGYVSTTINDLYAPVQPGPVTLNGTSVAKALAVSVVSCLVGALVPLWQASRVPPLVALRDTARHEAQRGPTRIMLAIGLALLAASWLIIYLPTSSPVVGFVMAMLLALGAALVCPWLTHIASQGLARLARARQWLALIMAGTGVNRLIGISGVAVAATMLALSMNVGVSTMVSCFRGALGRWMEERFNADVLIAPDLLVNHKIDSTLDPRVQQWVDSQTNVDHAIAYHVGSVEANGISTTLVASAADELCATLPLKSHDSRHPFDPVQNVIVSEPLAGRARVTAGDTLTLLTPLGPRPYTVWAVYYDFGSEHGQVLMQRSQYIAIWHDQRITSLHVFLKKDAQDPQAVAADWATQLTPRFPVAVNSVAQVKVQILEIFDRTFKVTHVLSWLAGAVAFCGLAGSLLALSLARQRQHSILAAIGLSAKQTAAWVLGEGLLLAWTAGIVACAAGTLLAYVLAYVIQYRSFGWSIPTSPQPLYWVQTLVLATLAALAAVIYPVYRLKSIAPASGLRQE